MENVVHSFKKQADEPIWAHSVIQDNNVLFITVKASSAEHIHSNTARIVADKARRAENIYPDYGIEAYGSPYIVGDDGKVMNPMVVPENKNYHYERKFKISRGL